MRRILALVLSVVMVLALPVMGFAGSGGSSRSGSATPKEGTTTETLSDGTVVETQTLADGTVITTTTTPEGDVSVDADVSTKGLNSAKEDGKAYTISSKAKADRDPEKATPVTVEVPGSAGKSEVEVAVDNLTNGVVAAQVMSDGSLKLVKTSTVGENGVVFKAQGNATYKMLVNDKTFTDLTADWQKAGVDFVSSRELMVGVGEGKFDPDGEVTEGMMATVLGRLGDEVTTEASTGEDWEEAGMSWAETAGYAVEDAENVMTREAMMVMLWKFAGSPAAESDLSAYTDADSVSADAAGAVAWCVANGIVFGTSGSTLNPAGTATRAQLATVLMRYCALL